MNTIQPYVGPNLWLRARLEIVQAINESRDSDRSSYHEARLDGFNFAALVVLGDGGFMALHKDCDEFYSDQGIDRPMCGGVWL